MPDPKYTPQTTNSMRLHLEYIHRLSLSTATQELHRAVQDVYATRTRDAWRHLLNHLRALRLLCASDLEIEGGVESLHTHASLPVTASPAKDLPNCLYSALRSVVLARKAPQAEALQVCTYSDIEKIVRVRVVNSIVRAVMRKGILTRATVEEFGGYLLRRRLPAPSFFNDHDCLEQLIAALVEDLCAYRDNAQSGPLLCLFWIGLQEFAYRTFRAWETVAARETRAEHWLRMLHAYAGERRGWMQVEGIVRTVLDCAKLEQVVSFFGDQERVDFMRKMMQNLQQKILPAATQDDAPPPPESGGGAWQVPVGRDEGLTVRVGDLDDCVLATHVLWKHGPVCEHMVTCVALEFVVQLAAAVRAQGGLWLVGDWYLMPNGSLMTDLSEAPAWCAC